MRLALVVIVAACGGAGAPPQATPRPQLTCHTVIEPLVDRQVRASVAEIVAREHLDGDEHDRLNRLAKERAVWLTVTMEQSCTDDRWSNAALLCYDQARTDDQMRVCDRRLSDAQRTSVLRRAGL